MRLQVGGFFFCVLLCFVCLFCCCCFIYDLILCLFVLQWKEFSKCFCMGKAFYTHPKCYYLLSFIHLFQHLSPGSETNCPNNLINVLIIQMLTFICIKYMPFQGNAAYSECNVVA